MTVDRMAAVVMEAAVEIRNFYDVLMDFVAWTLGLGIFPTLVVVGYIEKYPNWFIGTFAFSTGWAIIAVSYNYKRLIKAYEKAQ